MKLARENECAQEMLKEVFRCERKNELTRERGRRTVSCATDTELLRDRDKIHLTEPDPRQRERILL